MTIENEDTTTTTPETDEEATVVAAKREPTEYERELRRENRKARERHNAEVASLKAAYEEQLGQLTRTSQQKLVRAELKAQALKAGIIDTDLLNLVDLASVKLSPEGDVLNAQEVLADFAKAKPQFFGPVTTTSTAEAPRPRDTTQTRSFSEMSPAEQQAWERQFGIRR